MMIARYAIEQWSIQCKILKNDLCIRFPKMSFLSSGFPTRRKWLQGMVGASALGRVKPVWGQKGTEDVDVSDKEQSAVEVVLQRFNQARLQPPRITRNRRFVAIGTARSEYVRQVLRIAEETAVAYERFIGGLRLPVKFGTERLPLIVVANSGQYSQLLGEKKAKNEGGHYDLDENWVATFDHKGRQRSTRSDLERANLVTLMHEIAHQISFNTGLLNIRGDVPMVLSEGLATLAEPGGSSLIPGFGEVNAPRLGVMAQIMKRNRKAWIPLSDLIADDNAFDSPDENTVQMAYSQSWLFWNTLIAQAKTREKLNSYLQRIDRRLKPDQRINDFAAVMGPLDIVEKEMYKRQGEQLR